MSLVNPPVLPEIRVWQRIRRYAVPAAMIAACTAAREAGDWRAACAAARIDVAFDLVQVGREHGRAQAERIEADLVVLAPDLLRWHLPRVLGGRTSLATNLQFLLSTSEGRFGEDDVALVLYMPKTVDGSQRLRLTIRPVFGEPERYDLPPVFWSAAHVGGLAAAYGGSPARLPGLEPDGTVRQFEAYATTVDPADPASRVEVFDRLMAAGDLVAAWTAAGIDLDPTRPHDSWYYDSDLGPAAAAVLLPIQFDAELTRLQNRYGSSRTVIFHDWRACIGLWRRDDGNVAASLIEFHKIKDDELRPIAPVVHDRPADLELVRHGLLAPADLHPLVRRALFPAASAAPTTVDRPELRVSVPVRCRGEWHRVVHGDGRLELASHTPDEVTREELLRTLGGQVAGCFAVAQAWRGSGDRLPRRLRELRREVLLRIQHSGSAALTSLLDSGLDPWMGDGRGGTLLHHLRAVGDVTLVRRLTDAGVPVNATNRHGRTALHVAVGDGGSPEMVRALLEAGADPQARDAYDQTVVEVADDKAEMYDDEDSTASQSVSTTSSTTG
ncbi:MAG TPA: ankyrin repeat domain-containing protein [Micromonospora sp.]|nr:ankyrin repeat domain-containing protein [Micromonospora sp.]